MKSLRVEDLEAFKIENRQGLFQKDIFDKKDGATQFSFHLSIMEKGGYGQLHLHPHSEHVILVIKGSLILRNAKETHPLDVGMAILIMPNEEHEVINSFDGMTEYYVIYAPQR
jgi:quercetin dioxygenase-like cupin family protein